MTDTVLTLNAGSSSVKFQIFGQTPDLPRLAAGGVSGIGTAPVFTAYREGEAETKTSLPPNATQETAVQTIIDWVHNHAAGWRITTVAHRIVHGGSKFVSPARITPDIMQELRALIPLAPLHQPHNLASVDIAARFLPQTPQIACFDTAFHAGHNDLVTRYAIPQDIKDKGVRRYGFHGLSYEWIARVLKQDHPDIAAGRIIVAHLGNGSSLCGLKKGVSIDTTMSMTALDGVPMGTRSGAIDPGAVIYMIRDLGLGADKTEHALYEQSGLKGLSGITNDVKTLLQSTDPRAKFALDHFAFHVAKQAAMMAVAIGGIDAFVFTGGIGENAAPLRDAILGHLGFLNIPRTLGLIPANEERMMALQALICLKN